MKFDNCGSIRGDSNRIEDSVGGGLIFTSPGAIGFTNTYFNNNGSAGSAADKTAGKKDFTGWSGGGITASVDGVDVITITTPANGSKLGDGVYIHGFVRQAREYQQIRRLVNINAPTSTYKPGRDIRIDLHPWPDEQPPQPKNIDDSTRWNAMGGTVGTFWSSTAVITGTAPIVFENAGFLWKGELIPEIHGRAYYLRKQLLNPYDEEVYYNINVASVSATATAATWASGTNANKDHLVTYALSANLTGTLGVTHAVRISGMAQAVNNGVFNISAITTNSVTVHNPARLDATADESGASGTVTGPSPALLLDVSHPGRTYDIRVAKAASTENLRVYDASDNTLLTTISAAGTQTVRKTPLLGWHTV
jgi:hypothetical protein